jgi:hypothetical protein
MQLGFIESVELQPREDAVKICCKDSSMLLWETSLFLSINPAPPTIEFVKDLADSLGIVYYGLTRNGQTFSTIYDFIENQRRLVGMVDVLEKGKFLILDGQRAWDVIQSAAVLDDARTFVYKNTLWYGPYEFLRAGSPKFYLQWGKNIVDINVQYSPAQSKDVAVVMAVTNTINPQAPPDGGSSNQPDKPDEVQQSSAAVPATSTYYFIMHSPTARPIFTDRIPAGYSPLRGKVVYYLGSYNIGSGGVMGDLQAVSKQVVGAYRNIVSKLYVFDITIPGHPLAGPLVKYILRNYPDTALQEIEIEPDTVVHRFSKGHGWSTSITGSRYLELPQFTDFSDPEAFEEPPLFEGEDGQPLIPGLGEFNEPQGFPEEPPESFPGEQ